MTESPTQLRERAAAHDREAHDSFERCDTDGFLSQWASGLTAQQLRREATIAENGGVASFLALFTTGGEWVPAKPIDGRYGTRWMVLDTTGKATGEFLPYLPVRRDTLAKRGYVEGYACWPAKAAIHGTGRGLSGAATCRVVNRKTVPDHQPPTTVETTDRWAD